MKSLKVPLVRIKDDYLPTIGLLLKKNNVRAKQVDFRTEILEPQLEEWGTKWKKKEFRDATLTGRFMRFETTKAEALEQAKKAIPNLEDAILRFLKRWGFAYKVNYDEVRNKVRFQVDFNFDEDRVPLITLEEDSAVLPSVNVTFGFTRLNFTFGPRHIEMLVEVSQGGNFTPLHSTKCLYNDVSDMRPFLIGMMDVVNKGAIKVRPVPEDPAPDHWPTIVEQMMLEIDINKVTASPEVQALATVQPTSLADVVDVDPTTITEVKAEPATVQTEVVNEKAKPKTAAKPAKKRTTGKVKPVTFGK
jgi:hypothetical protein